MILSLVNFFVLLLNFKLMYIEEEVLWEIVMIYKVEILYEKF